MPSTIIMDLAFDKANSKTSLSEFPCSDQALAYNRSHEMDVKIDGRKILAGIQSPTKGDAHRGIGKQRPLGAPPGQAAPASGALLGSPSV